MIPIKLFKFYIDDGSVPKHKISAIRCQMHMMRNETNKFKQNIEETIQQIIKKNPTVQEIPYIDYIYSFKSKEERLVAWQYIYNLYFDGSDQKTRNLKLNFTWRCKPRKRSANLLKICDSMENGDATEERDQIDLISRMNMAGDTGIIRLACFDMISIMKLNSTKRHEQTRINQAWELIDQIPNEICMTTKINAVRCLIVVRRPTKWKINPLIRKIREQWSSPGTEDLFSVVRGVRPEKISEVMFIWAYIYGEMFDVTSNVSRKQTLSLNFACKWGMNPAMDYIYPKTREFETSLFDFYAFLQTWPNYQALPDWVKEITGDNYMAYAIIKSVRSIHFRHYSGMVASIAALDTEWFGPDMPWEFNMTVTEAVVLEECMRQMQKNEIYKEEYKYFSENYEIGEFIQKFKETLRKASRMELIGII